MHNLSTVKIDFAIDEGTLKAHAHRESERGPLVLSWWFNFNLAARELNYLLADHETHAEALLIHDFCSRHLTEPLEKLAQLIVADTFTSVNDLHLEKRLLVYVAGMKLYSARESEFQSVFGQIDQYLF